MPTPQSFQNHAKYVPGYHWVTFGLILVLLAWSVSLLVRHPSLAGVMQLITALVLGMTAFYARVFGVGAQDRVIRLEEQLRMARVLPDDLKARVGELRLAQFVALRFAPDAELPGLVRRVLGGELPTQRAIKEAIKDWRPDYERV